MNDVSRSDDSETEFDLKTVTRKSEVVVIDEDNPQTEEVSQTVLDIDHKSFSTIRPSVMDPTAIIDYIVKDDNNISINDSQIIDIISKPILHDP